jgi:hypothetical protein
MLTRRKEALAFAAAVGLHALALLVLRATLGRAPAVPAKAPAISPFDVVWVEGMLDEPPPAPSPVRAPAADARSARQERNNPKHDSPPHAEDPTADEAPSNHEAPSNYEAPSDHEGPSLHEAAEPIDLGLGPDGWQRWVTAPNAGAPERSAPKGRRSNRFQVFRAPPVSTTGGLQEGLEEHDRALGIGPQGRVLSALHQAAHQRVAPYAGVARFDVTIRRTGVVEVTLGDASGGVEAWRKVAEHIAKELSASPPRIAPPREGVRLVVELVAEETMPNGTKVTSLRGPHLDVSPPKLQSTDRSIEDVSNDNPVSKDANPNVLPPIKLDLPGVYLAERGKVCSYRLGLSMLGPVFQGGCDPTHIGAKPQRMVRARVLEQTMF